MDAGSIKPFRALLYNKDKIEDISTCVCPPYDVITDRDIYTKKNAFNAIKIELPVPNPPLDEYNAAKQTLDEWLRDKILIHDSKETIYIYEQSFEFNGSSLMRRGFVALNRLDRDRILIHEATRAKAKKDRERLITTLKTYTSFIFGLYEDKENHIEDLLVNAERELVYDLTDDNAIENRFYRITSRDHLQDICRMMEDKKIYIADGHHRLDVSYRLGLDYIPIYLTNMYGTGIVVWPYHRIIRFKRKRTLADILDTLSNYMDIEKTAISGSTSITGAVDVIASEKKPTYAIYSKDDTANIYIIKQKRPVVFKEGIHDVLKRLKVNILHSGILNNILGIEEDEISFTQDPLSFIESIKNGSIDLMVFLPATTVEEVKDIADNYLYMPPKSTFFYPKVLTGPIFYKYG